MSRIVVTAYGLSSYLLFLITFLYLAGFLLEILVPKSINDPWSTIEPFAIHAGRVDFANTQGSSALWINLGLVAIFGATHSVMARDWFKRAFTKILPAAAERSTFVLQSSLCLALAMWQWRAMDSVIWSVDGVLAWVAYGVFAAGVAIVLVSTFLIDHFELFGLRQIWSNQKRVPMPKPEFKTPMLYRIVRHPMQLGIMILLFATPHMTLGHLIFAGAMTAYIFVGLHFEERALTRQFGDRYRAYKAQVPLLIPRFGPIYPGPQAS